jgi:hypothetical protein
MLFYKVKTFVCCYKIVICYRGDTVTTRSCTRPLNARYHKGSLPLLNLTFWLALRAGRLSGMHTGGFAEIMEMSWTQAQWMFQVELRGPNLERNFLVELNPTPFQIGCFIYCACPPRTPPPKIKFWKTGLKLYSTIKGIRNAKLLRARTTSLGTVRHWAWQLGAFCQ